MVDVFISYARAERQKAIRLKEALERLGLSVFFDTSELDAGSDFPVVIDHAVKSAGAVVACWSPLAFRRDWVMKECLIASHRKVLIPVAIEMLDPLDIRVDFHGIDYADLCDFDGRSSHQGFDKLVRALESKLNRRLSDSRVAPRTTVASSQSAFEGVDAMVKRADLLFKDGRAAPADMKKAADLYEAAAQQGNVHSMLRMSWVACDGLGRPKDVTQQIAWLENAFYDGHNDSAFSIGCIYRQGSGVAVDFAAAREWYEAGAAAGCLSSINNLGYMNFHAEGGPVDKAAAKAWWRKGAAVGYAGCKENLQRYFPNG